MAMPITVTLWMLLMSHANKETLLNNRYNAWMLFFILISGVSISVVMRDFNYIDTDAYIMNFSQIGQLNFTEIFSFYAGEALFVSLNWIVAQFTSDPRIFLLVMWMAFIIPFIKFLTRLFTPWQTAVVFFAFINYPIFYSYTLNVIRQGLAITLVLLACSYYFTEQKSRKPYLYLVFGALLHWTCIPISIAIALLVKKDFKLRGLLIMWGFAAVLYVSNLNSVLVSKLTFIPFLDKYSGGDIINTYSGEVNGLDFLLFSLVWVVVSLLLYYFLHRSEMYLRIIKAYVLLNSIFVLFGFITFADRIAGYSWLLIPIIVLYPILKAKKYRKSLAFSAILLSFGVGIFAKLYGYYDPLVIFR